MPPPGAPLGCHDALREPKALPDGQQVGRARADHGPVRAPDPIHECRQVGCAGAGSQDTARDRPEAVARAHDVAAVPRCGGSLDRGALGGSNHSPRRDFRRWCLYRRGGRRSTTAPAGCLVIWAVRGRQPGRRRRDRRRRLDRRRGWWRWSRCHRLGRCRRGSGLGRSLGQRRFRLGCRRDLGRRFGRDRRRQLTGRDRLRFLSQLLELLRGRVRQILALGLVVGQRGAGRDGGHEHRRQRHARACTLSQGAFVFVAHTPLVPMTGCSAPLGCGSAGAQRSRSCTPTRNRLGSPVPIARAFRSHSRWTSRAI